jgi:hypothetical protein
MEESGKVLDIIDEITVALKDEPRDVKTIENVSSRVKIENVIGIMAYLGECQASEGKCGNCQT